MDPITAKFVFGCIPARLGLAYVAGTPQFKWLKVAVAAAIGIGFLVLYFQPDLRTTGAFDNNPVWWNHPWRLLHGLMFLAYALSVSVFDVSPGTASAFLYGDAVLGIAAFATRP